MALGSLVISSVECVVSEPIPILVIKFAAGMMFN